MIDYHLSPLTVHSLLQDLGPIHKTIKEKFDEINVPLLYKESQGVYLTPETRSRIFEVFSIQCDHYGSADAFYAAVMKLNYFIVATEFSKNHNITFQKISIGFEDLLILNSFKIFKDLK